MRELKFRLRLVRSFLNAEGNRTLSDVVVGYEKWYPGKWGEFEWEAQPCWLYSIDGHYWNPEPIPHSHKDLFTGLHDKNGKEIYEGDILQTYRAELWQVIYGMDGHGKTIGFHCMLLPDTVANSWRDRLFLPQSNDYEVIGNIYENSELVKP